MKKTIFGILAGVFFMAGTMSLTPANPQDQQQDKTRKEQRKDKKDKHSDTMSNRRMHDDHMPPTMDSMPQHRQPTPLPDTINRGMH